MTLKLKKWGNSKVYPTLTSEYLPAIIINGVIYGVN